MTEASGIREQALRCRDAAQALAQLDSVAKDALLESMARALEDDADAILAANARDLEAARGRGTGGAMLYPKPGVMRLAFDEGYVMASLGVLAKSHPAAARKLLVQYLRFA